MDQRYFLHVSLRFMSVNVSKTISNKMKDTKKLIVSHYIYWFWWTVFPVGVGRIRYFEFVYRLKKYKIEEWCFFTLFFRQCKILFYHSFSHQTIIKVSSLRVSHCPGTFGDFVWPLKEKNRTFSQFHKMLFSLLPFYTKLPWNSFLCIVRLIWLFTFLSPSRKEGISYTFHLQVLQHRVQKSTLIWGDWML